MLNKNVADYTNFDGKTNKKIVQAPGGASSFSLAWNNQKTDYGPQRVYKKKDNLNTYNDTPSKQNIPNYQKQQAFNYNEPIKLLDDRPVYQPQYIPPKQEVYSSHSSQSTGNHIYGSEYGYNNYVPNNYPPEEVSYQPRSKQQIYQQDSLDLKLKEQLKVKTPSIPPMAPNSNQRACIKIHEQKNNMIFGDNSYNYWKDTSDGDRRNSNHSSKRPPLYEQPVSQYEQKHQPYPEKTSVKVHNPPGGKSSFTLG